MPPKPKKKNSRMRGPGLVRVTVQELKRTGDFANARIAAGIQLPVTADQTHEEVADLATVLVSQQVKLRIAQVFRREQPLELEDLNCPGALVFAGVSRLEPTAEFENVRVDVEYAHYLDAEAVQGVGKGQTINNAFDRAFEEVGQQIGKAIKYHRGEGSDARAVRRPGKAASFEWGV